MQKYRNVRDRLGKQRPNRVELDLIKAMEEALESLAARLEALEAEVYTVGGE